MTAERTIRDEYIALIAEAKQVLIEEYTSGTWVPTDLDTLSYFRDIALRATKQKVTIPQPQVQKVSSQPAAIAKSVDAPTTKQPEAAYQFKPSYKTDLQGQNSKVKSLSEPSPPETPSAPLSTRAAKEKPPLHQRQPFQLELLATPSDDDFSDFKQFMAKSFPQVSIHVNPPVDDTAKEFLQQWNQSLDTAAVLLLVYDESNSDTEFLSSLQLAIDITLGIKTALYQAYRSELLGNWSDIVKNPNLRLILTHKGKMELLPQFLSLYKDDPRPHVGRVPVLPLCDISLYMQEPHLKMKLWHEITALLKSS